MKGFLVLSDHLKISFLIFLFIVFFLTGVTQAAGYRESSKMQRVIPVNSIVGENAPDPMPFIQANFYQPRIAGALFPISPQAFSHYNFRFVFSG